MAYRTLGPSGARDVWLVLHGGPGSGGNLGLAQPFDLKSQRVILPDQRGSGASRPRGSTRSNTLGHLVRDLEALRLHLGLHQWHVLGGSWGATLALAYAASHPTSVGSLVLRGAFDANGGTVRRLFQRFWPDRPPFPAGLGGRPMCHRLSQLLHGGAFGVTQARVLIQWQRMELDAVLVGARRAAWAAIDHPHRLQARQHWQALQRQWRQLTACAPSRRQLLALRPKYRIQAHYLSRGCWVAPGDWTRWLDRAAGAGMGVQWVQGRFDMVCPRGIAGAAHARWRSLAPTASRLHLVLGGHLGTDPGVLAALRACVANVSQATS